MSGGVGLSIPSLPLLTLPCRPRPRLHRHSHHSHHSTQPTSSPHFTSHRHTLPWPALPTRPDSGPALPCPPPPPPADLTWPDLTCDRSAGGWIRTSLRPAVPPSWRWSSPADTESTSRWRTPTCAKPNATASTHWWTAKRRQTRSSGSSIRWVDGAEVLWWSAVENERSNFRYNV